MLLSIEDGWLAQSRQAANTGAARTFYSKAPERSWALQRKVLTVVCAATLSWGAVFGVAAIIFHL